MFPATSIAVVTASRGSPPSATAAVNVAIPASMAASIISAGIPALPAASATAPPAASAASAGVAPPSNAAENASIPIVSKSGMSSLIASWPPAAPASKPDSKASLGAPPCSMTSLKPSCAAVVAATTTVGGIPSAAIWSPTTSQAVSMAAPGSTPLPISASNDAWPICW